MPFDSTDPTDDAVPERNDALNVCLSFGVEFALAVMNSSCIGAVAAAIVMHDTAAGPLRIDTWPTVGDSGFAHRSTSTMSGNVPFALSADAVIVADPGATAVISPD